MGTDGRATTAGPFGTDRGDVPEPHRCNDDTPRPRYASSSGLSPLVGRVSDACFVVRFAAG